MRFLVTILSVLLLTACSNIDTNKTEPSPESSAAARSFTNKNLTGDGPAGVDQTWQSAIDAGVTVNTFQQKAKGKNLDRRYLMYLPKSYSAETSYPLVIMTHGRNINAEITREFDTDKDLEKLADKKKFVVVYANAVANEKAEPEDDPFMANSGEWIRGKAGMKGDLDYFVKIEEDLANKGIKINPDARFIAGISNGGEMVLEATQRLYPRYRAGYAGIPVPVRMRKSSMDISMMIYYSEKDPLLLEFFPKYNELMQKTSAGWAKSLGIPKDQYDNAKFTPIANTKNEGAKYKGNNEVALATRNSQLEEVKFDTPDGKNQLWLIKSADAGHGIPHPLQFDIPSTVENGIGFRNEDMNTIEVMWDFFEQFIEQ